MNIYFSFLLQVLLASLASSVPCTSPADCHASVGPGSTCDDLTAAGAGGVCTSPFASGCLRSVLGSDAFPTRRVCNSDDGPDDGNCDPPQFDYTEVRILPGNWDSSILLSFVYQIILSELVGVPTTIDSGGANVTLSFYDNEMRYGYPQNAYNFEGLIAGNRVGDCRLLVDDQTCGHVIPEVWNGNGKKLREMLNEGQIEPPEGNGMVGKNNLYVPSFVVHQDASLASYVGLAGEMNRRKLAETFKRPTTWMAYCEEVSSDGCAAPDGTAKRKPSNESSEADAYHVPGLYTGFFRRTEKNDCDASPAACSGHVVDYPCSWSTKLEVQMYWNNIALESDGSKDNGGYSYTEMMQIWEAANATKSPVMMLWWQADPLFHKYKGSESDFFPVTLPLSTEECEEARISDDDRCSTNATVRRGTKLGSCGYPMQVLQKWVVASMESSTYAEKPSTRSPAYAIIKRIRLKDLTVYDFLEAGVASQGSDRYGYVARAAVCEWVANNLELIKDQFIPNGYPRQLVNVPWYSSTILYVAMAFGAFAIISSLLTAFLTYIWRDRRVMIYAQVKFLFLIILGFILVSADAVILVMEPSDAICVAGEWFKLVGYTLSLVPILVKVSAINTLAAEARRMKRVTLTPRQLFGTITLVMTMVIVFLIVWTVVDPPTKTQNVELTQDTLVESSTSCASKSNGWLITSFVWQAMLLFSASILAFQSRKVPQEFNEARSLALLAYSHFFFASLRAMVQLFPHLQSNTRAGATSLLLSCDAIFAIGIYFASKFLFASKNADPARKDLSQLSINWPKLDLVKRGLGAGHCNSGKETEPSNGSSGITASGLAAAKEEDSFPVEQFVENIHVTMPSLNK